MSVIKSTETQFFVNTESFQPLFDAKSQNPAWPVWRLKEIDFIPVTCHHHYYFLLDASVSAKRSESQSPLTESQSDI